MSKPRRDASTPDPELARLAAEGAARRARAASEAQVEHDRDAERHLRTAIGAYRGSVLRRFFLVLTIVSALCGVALISLSPLSPGTVHGNVVPIAFGATLLLFFTWLFVPPLASNGAMARETEWVGALPFELAGYFDVLRTTPSFSRRVTFDIRWKQGGVTPDRDFLFAAVGAADPAASVQSPDPGRVVIVSGPVSGVTGIRNNRVPVYRNHELPGRVHAIVEKVLVPLHGSYPIERVSLRAH